jgi:DNA-binding IclR family transcriptional regulator
MKRLAERKAHLEAEGLQKPAPALELVTEAHYERLLAKLKTQLTDLSPESKRRIIHALVHRVIVTRDGFELRFYVGVEQIKTAEAFASAAFSLSKKISAASSFKHLNGGP